MSKRSIVLLLSIVHFSHISLNASDTYVKSKVDSLVNQMTLKEKIGQMNQLSYDLDIKNLETKIENGEVGSLLNIVDIKVINELQCVAAEKSRLGIPLLIGRDVIHGFKTIFPIPLGLAASFNPQLVEECARISAIEASEVGINWTFAPMIDISRDPRWGRIAESFGEDTYLTSVMGDAMIRGFQGSDLSYENSIAACAKHFAGYGASEGGRDYNSTNIPERLMRNTYLPPFKAAVKAGVATIMTSFNDNDGIPASANDYLLKNILRGEWKFDGVVVSDWASMLEMIDHGFAEDKKNVSELSANAGVDMEMVSETYIQYLESLVEEGLVLEADIDNAVRNILRLKFRLGLFSNPYTKQKKSAYAENHLLNARKTAVESVVLLRNNNVLPLKEAQKVAIIGPMADASHDQLGTWVFDGEKSHTVTPLKALQTEYKNVKYVYEPALRYTRDIDTVNFQKVKDAAKWADATIVFVGEEAILSGEAHSLANINLIGAQSELLKAAKSVGKPVIAIVMAGRPLAIERDLPYTDALLYSFHPGTMGGPAIMDILFGKENPSGKLPVTFPRHVGQIPIYYNHNNTGRPAPDDHIKIDEIAVEANQTSLGNTSFYLDYGKEPLFFFGYGLSYSKFSYSNMELSSSQINMLDTLVVRITITNTSIVPGKEVVQLYIKDKVGSIVRPIKELKAFQKIELNAYESKTIDFELTADDFAFYGKDCIRKSEAGEFDVWIGKNSCDGIKKTFHLKR